MRRARKFQPSSMTALEGRVVLSHVVNLTANLDNMSRPPADVAQTLSPSAMVQGAPEAPAGGNTFALDISDTLKAGLPVYEQRQTIYSDKADNQFIDELIVPNLATGGRTTTEWIGDGTSNGVEKVVNVKTVSGNTTTNTITTTLANGNLQTEVETAVVSGNTTSHTNVTTLADGTVQTNSYTDVTEGSKMLIKNGTEPAPNGGTEHYSGVQVTHGAKTITTKTFVGPTGQVKQTQTVATNLGDSGQNETVTVTLNHHETITNNTTIVSRLNPPAS